jgi:hypothetical protein
MASASAIQASTESASKSWKEFSAGIADTSSGMPSERLPSTVLPGKAELTTEYVVLEDSIDPFS